MTYQHGNRRGDVYLLQAGRTKTGKSRYYFGRRLTGDPVPEVPAGYEVFESPERGQVYLRRQRATCIAATEREIVAEGIRDVSNVEHFVVDVEEDCLVVYLPTKSVNEVNELVCFLAGPQALQVPRFREARDQVVRESRYEKMMRFLLLDPQHRVFDAERWCFRSFHNGWIHIGGPAPLSDLIEQYAEHLGEDSFYELF
jgi:uncharacterized protein (UPF0297 family)